MSAYSDKALRAIVRCAEGICPHNTTYSRCSMCAPLTEVVLAGQLLAARKALRRVDRDLMYLAGLAAILPDKAQAHAIEKFKETMDVVSAALPRAARDRSKR